MEETSVFEDTQLCFTEIKQESRQHLTERPVMRNISKFWEYLHIITEAAWEKAKKGVGEDVRHEMSEQRLHKITGYAKKKNPTNK